jgi:hypothetical protein
MRESIVHTLTHTHEREDGAVNIDYGDIKFFSIIEKYVGN